MDVFVAMRMRRMHRRFTDEAVSEEVLAKLSRRPRSRRWAATSLSAGLSSSRIREW